jgi:hypothetical protein
VDAGACSPHPNRTVATFASISNMPRPALRTFERTT